MGERSKGKRSKIKLDKEMKKAYNCIMFTKQFFCQKAKPSKAKIYIKY